jgi:ribonucleotide reductase beta subunit family protein with ferritin-like domain
MEDGKSYSQPYTLESVFDSEKTIEIMNEVLRDYTIESNFFTQGRIEIESSFSDSDQKVYYLKGYIPEAYKAHPKCIIRYMIESIVFYSSGFKAEILEEFPKKWKNRQTI